jgi:DNA-directed RNA polymerase subunit RPC12/RpoP
MEQLKIVNLKCLGCGGALEISADMERFACGYCGSEQMVLRRGGTVALKPVVDAVARVQVGTDKTAAELALVRLGQELAQAQFRLHSFDQDFLSWKTGRPQSSLPLLAMIAPIVFGLAIVIAATDAGPIIAVIAFAGCAICGVPAFIWGAKKSTANKKDEREQRRSMWNVRYAEVQRLEALIAKQRGLVDN